MFHGARRRHPLCGTPPYSIPTKSTPRTPKQCQQGVGQDARTRVTGGSTPPPQAGNSSPIPGVVASQRAASPTLPKLVDKLETVAEGQKDDDFLYRDLSMQGINRPDSTNEDAATVLFGMV